MTTSGTSGKGINSKKSLRSKAAGAPKDPTQSVKADSSLLSPAVLMALGMAGMAVAAVPDNASDASPSPENQAEQDLAPEASQPLPQVAQTPIASDLQMQLADLITDLQAQAGQMPAAALPLDLEALLAAMAPQDALGMEQMASASSAGAADMEPIMLAQATVTEAAVPQAASAASTAAADAGAAAGASAAAASATSLSGVLLAAGAIGLAAAAGVGKSSDTSDKVPPAVSKVEITSATGAANSTLNAGDVVTVTVTMSEATTVTGSPTVALNIGGTTVSASYDSANSTSTALKFNYTVLAGQTDTNGVSVDANSLAANAGTLKDAAGNSATLTHSAVTDNSSYLVDTTAPTVSKVEITSATGAANSTLNAGDVVTVTVTMSEATTVTGSPTVALNIGGTTVSASYDSANSTSTALKFNYTVLAGQTDTNGVSVDANSLAANAGTLKDAAGNSATLTHSAVTDNSSYLVDTTAPTITLLAASASAGTVTLTYNSALDASNAPAASSFTVTTGGATNAVTAVSVVGAVVTLTVTPFAAGSITVAYADPTSGNDAKAIQDLAGNDAAGFASGVVADGYVRGATVYIDTNNDGTGDVLVGTTDASGNFFIPAGTATGTIIAIGGVNIDTGLANTVELKAPAGSTTINPLTTLVQAVVQASGGATTAAAAAVSVATSLGLTLSSGESLLSYDPIAAASSTDATAASNAVAAQKAAAQVATIVALAESASTDAGDSVIANLATVITSSSAGTTVNLADSTTITSMLGTALDSASATVKAAAQSAIADASTAISTSTSLASISSAQSQALDKTAPNAPTVAGDANTKDTTPTIRVTLNTTATDGTAVSAGDVLTLKDNNVQIGSTVTLTAADIAAGYKDLTVADANALTEGTHSLSVVVTDQGGNASAASASIAVNVDLTAPSAPIINAVATDNVINSAEQTSAISGTAEAAATVSLSIGGNVRTATASTGGVWTYTLSAADVTAMGQGAETLSATATDAAGNTSTAATLGVTVDTAAPTTTAAVTGANDNVDPTTGTVATGGTSNDNTLGLSGTVSAALTSGDVVAVYDGTTRLGVATVSGTTWSFDTAGLTNAAYIFKAQVEDAAGNAGAQGTAYTVTVNATVPTATVSVTAAALTSDTTPTLTGVVTGTLATGDVVNVYDGTALLGNGVASGSNWTFTPSTALGEGAHSFTAVVQNSGGNQGTFSTAAATTIDTTAPSTPGINTVATDNIVNALEVGSSISGTNEAGATVALSIGGNSRVATVSGSTWTYTLVSADITAMAQGAETLSATQTDAAGNISAAGTRAVTVDTVAPTVTDVLVSAGEAINASEFTAGVTITGAAEAGARVDITFADTTTVRSVTAGSTGAWTYTLVKADISAMGQGSETFTVKATDASANTGAAASTTISIDTAAPTVSSFALTTASDSGTKADGKSNVAAPSIELTAELGSTLSIDLGKGAGYQAAGTGTGASQTLTAGSAYTTDGSYTIKVKSTDAAGNTTERSGSYTYDSTVATPALALASDTSTGQKITSSGTVNVTGLESGATWEYSLNAGSTWTAGSGSSVALTGDGSKSITVRQTDTAGNISTASSALAFTLDTLVATPTLALSSDTGASASDKISQSGVVNVSGLEAGGKWEYSMNAGSTWTAGTQSSVTVTGDSSNSLTVRQTDTAGNVSTTSTALGFTVDTLIAKPTVSLTSDTGSSATDSISSSALVTLSAAAADVTRTYTVDGTTSSSYTAPTTNAVHTVVVTDTDTAGNVSSSQTLTFTLDKAVPTVATGGLSPADDGLSLGLTANLIVTMDEAVAKGTGSLTLYKAGDVLVETIAVSSTQVTLSQDGTIVTINPTADLVKDEKYYVKAAAGTFTDTAGNAWAGIDTATAWNFTGAGATVTINAVNTDNIVNLVESGTAITVTGTLGAESAVLAAYTVGNMTAVLRPASGSDVTLTSLTYAPATGVWSAVIPQSSLSGTANYTLTVSFKGTEGVAAGVNGDGVQVVLVDTVVAAPTLALTTDSGNSTTDKITSSAALTPTGETGSSFEYSADGTTWSATAPTATAGSNTVYARQTDAVGNVSAASTALTYVYDATGPKVSAVAISSATGAQSSTLNAGDVLSATVTMDSATTVTGTPQLALNIGGTTVQATYASGSGTSALVFNYTVLAGQNDANGISVAVNSLALNGGSMVDVAGNAATLTHALVADNSSYLVDTLAPTVSIVTPSTFTSTGGTFGFTFSESVTGFAATDITMTGGSAATVGGSGASYTSVVTPTASSSTSISPLAFAVNVAAEAAVDAAGNTSAAATAYTASILVGTSGNDTFAVNSSVNYLFLDAGGTDTLKLSAATGSTAAATDLVRGFGSGDKIDLAAILGSATGSGYTSSTLADTGSGFVELKNVTLTHATSTTTTVGFDITFDAATYEGNKISGAVIDLAYTYASVTSASVKSVTYTDTFGDAANFWPLTVTNMTGSSGTGKITAAAFSDDSSKSLWSAGTNTIIDSTGRTIAVKLVISENVSTFQLGFDGAGIVTTTSSGTDNSYTPTTGVTKTAGASAGTTGVLEIVSDTSTLGSGDNQLHMLTTYDSATGLTRLQIQYDSNPAYGTTAASSIIAMDFSGDLTSVLTPASLTFI